MNILNNDDGNVNKVIVSISHGMSKRQRSGNCKVCKSSLHIPNSISCKNKRYSD